jgi:8-oxo-dGTP diphosphatase
LEIRQIRPGEGELVRRSRLELLAEAPWRGALFDRERGRPDRYWETRAGTGAAGGELATLIALEAGDCVGIVDLVFAQATETAELAGMWVRPSHRRQGIGQALTAAAVRCAESRGTEEVGLWVITDNSAAVALYERCGFHRSGQPVPVEGHAGLSQIHMVRRIGEVNGADSDPREQRARVVIVDGERVALIKRVRAGQTYYLFPGGGVEEGETPEEAAVREAREELGVDVELAGVEFDEVFEGVRFVYFRAAVADGKFGTGLWPDHAHRTAATRAERGTYEAVWLPLADLERHDVRPRELSERLARDIGE